jgi:predicted ester cyclase
MDELYSAEFVYHRVPLPDIVGLNAYKQAIKDIRNSFSNVQPRFEEIIIEGDTVATRWRFSGKHTGQSPTIPIPPTNKQVAITGSSVTHTVGGKAVEEWNHADWFSFFQQVGVVPPLELGGK